MTVTVRGMEKLIHQPKLGESTFGGTFGPGVLRNYEFDFVRGVQSRPKWAGVLF